MSFKAELEILVKDRKGRIKTIHQQPMRSFVKQFLQHLKCLFQGSDESNVKDMNGNLKNLQYTTEGSYHYMCMTFGFDTKRGVIIGSGTTPPSNDDYKLESEYTDSEFSYGSNSISLTEEDGYLVLRIARMFTNVSGSSKTISEVGLGCCSRASDQYPMFLLARDVLSSPITVEDGEQVIIRYKIKTMA